MGLQFLVPALLAGLVALAVPVIIHLTRRQRSRVIEFPSLMFLERIPYRSMRRRKIRNWFLLLVRAAALGLLVVAFARPLFTDLDLEAGTVIGPREVVILLDRSYSMAQGGRWDRATEAARRIVTDLQPIDRASLILFDTRAQAVLRSSSDADLLQRALGEARVGSMATRFGPGLKLAESILTDTDLPNREVVLISDFQRAGWNGEEDVRFPSTTRITPIAVVEADAAPPENRTVSELDLGRELFSGRERVRVAARIARVGGDAPATVPVTLVVDGRVQESRSVELDPDGAAQVSFEAVTLSEAFTRGEVRIEEDGLPPDDARRFVLSPGRASSVLVVRSARASERSALYLSRALGIAGDVPYRTDVRTAEALTGDLTQRSVIVLNDAALPSGDAADGLRRYLEGGGGLLVILGEASRISADAADLLPVRIGEPADREPPGRLGYVDYTHPVLDAFAGADGGDFSRARFYRYRRLEPEEEAEVLARFDDGAPAIVAGRVGPGRVVVWASSADNFWNDLVLQPLFLPLLHQTVAYLRNDAAAPEARTAGDVLDLSTPESVGLRAFDALPTGALVDQQRVALTPSGASVEIPLSSEQPFLDLEESGFYVIRAPGSEEPRPVTVAVNVDVSEADLRSMDPEELVLAIRAPAVASEEENGTPQPGQIRVEDLERRQGLWRFLLVGAFLLLVTETVLSNTLSRRATGAGGLNA